MITTGFFRTKLWLWAVVAATLILAAGYIPIVHEERESFSYWGCWGVVLRGGAFIGTIVDTGMILVIEGLKWGAILVALGWVVHRGLLTALFRDSAKRASVRNASTPHPAVRSMHRRTVIAASVVLGALTTPFAACVLAWVRTPPLSKAVLRYPNGVSFTSGRVAEWIASEVNNPGPCPLTVHLPGVDLDGAALASPERLRELGWEVSELYREHNGRIYSVGASSPGQTVWCTYVRGRLAHVRVGMDRVPVAGEPPPEKVAVSLGGRRVELPSSNEAIIAALGQPL